MAADAVRLAVFDRSRRLSRQARRSILDLIERTAEPHEMPGDQHTKRVFALHVERFRSFAQSRTQLMVMTERIHASRISARVAVARFSHGGPGSAWKVCSPATAAVRLHMG
jgi:hypothetical protein